MVERDNQGEKWVTLKRMPGYWGKKKDEIITRFNGEHGEGNWRIAWELANGEVLNFEQVFWQVYVAGYTKFFLEHDADAIFLTRNFAFAYDKDQISRVEAFDLYALVDKPGRPNQFHHVALNVSLDWFLGIPFRGTAPIQVREGKLGTPVESWPQGYRWSPGRIPAVRPELIPDVEIANPWWNDDSIEGVYQRSKAIQVKRG